MQLASHTASLSLYRRGYWLNIGIYHHRLDTHASLPTMELVHIWEHTYRLSYRPTMALTSILLKYRRSFYSYVVQLYAHL